MTRTVSKVLPFKTERGEVAGHEVIAHNYDWLEGDRIESVAFSTWDKKAGMTIEVVVHWTKVTEYMLRKWPAFGEVKAVILRSGRRLHATMQSVRHCDTRAYDRAPLIARDVFRITTLGSTYPLWEIAGVREWTYTNRDEAATAKYLSCPWARDNAEYAARKETV